MRPTTVLSFLVASIAVLSPVYAAPAVTKRGCTDGVCKDAVLPPSNSGNSATSPSVSDLVTVLINTLQTFQSGPPTASNTTNNTLNVAVPKPSPTSTPLADLVAGAL